MSVLKYKVIKSRDQYDQYCQELEELIMGQAVNQGDVIELLTLLIEDWDRRQYQWMDLDPVGMVKELMKEHKMKATTLAEKLDITASALSNILNYRRRFTADHIRILSTLFCIDQQFFNKVYPIEYPKQEVKAILVADSPGSLASPAKRARGPVTPLEKSRRPNPSMAKKASKTQAKRIVSPRKTK